jgi:hypothetical protein
MGARRSSGRPRSTDRAQFPAPHPRQDPVRLRRSLVRRRSLDVIGDQRVAHDVCGLQLEAELFLNRGERRRDIVCRRRHAGRAAASPSSSRIGRLAAVCIGWRQARPEPAVFARKDKLEAVLLPLLDMHGELAAIREHRPQHTNEAELTISDAATLQHNSDLKTVITIGSSRPIRAGGGRGRPLQRCCLIGCAP